MKMKNVIYATCMMLASVCYANPINSALGSRHAINDQHNDAIENPYITDGLVAMWDGEWNVGFGVNNPNSTIWKDLIGTNDLIVQNVLGVGFVDNICFQTYVRNSIQGELSAICKNGMQYVTAEICSFMQVSGVVFYSGKSDQHFIVITTGYIQFLNPYCEGFPDGTPMPYYSTISGSILNGNVLAYCNGKKLERISRTNSWAYSRYNGQMAIGGMDNPYYSRYCFGGKIYCIRLYNRVLAEDEVIHNYLVDKARFGL